MWFLLWYFLHHEMCPHLEDLHNSMNQYFPDYCTMLQNPSRVKDSFRVPDQKQDKTKNQKNKVPDRPVDFNVMEYNKFINVVLHSILQALFKELPCIKFDIVSKKNICKDKYWNMPPFSKNISVWGWLSFKCFSQNSVSTDKMQEQIG